METIKLNKKKKKIMWKRIFITLLAIAILAGGIFFASTIRFGYRYYSIDENRNKIDLGISAQEHLLDTVLMEELDTAKQQGYQIADYNLTHIIDKKWVITWKKNKDNDEVIKSAIADSIYIIVYALKLDIDGKTYILPEKQGYQVLSALKQHNENINIDLLDGVFVNENEVLDQAAIDALLSDYEAK